MIDMKILREDPEVVRQVLKNRGVDMDLRKIMTLDAQRRSLVTEIQKYKQQRNEISEKVGKAKHQGKDPAEIMNKARELNKIIKEKEQQEKETECAFNDAAQWLPNIPHDTVPVGMHSDDNQFIRGLTEPPKFDFQVLKHWEIAEALNILDLKRTPKISGSRFITYTGVGARLERALINFFLDLHTKKHGYLEIMPPVLNPASTLYGTGQLPKLASDMYKCRDDELYLTPTAEVPLTNLHSGEIIPEKKLPICYVAYTPCFRREAGSYGKEVRGIKRVHQFNKVELVKYATPENGYAEFERVLSDAETAVTLLGLPYRIMLLCTGEMTFAAAKTYDIEVYAAGVQEWLEVSSVSIYEQYQARRANIRFRG
ncbi:seryl-tRNA synthetase, partial [candidate division WOR_3 bacterium SM23_60]